MLPDTLWHLSPQWRALKDTPYERALCLMLDELRLDALFKSPIHGKGHIMRVMALGALLALHAQADTDMTRLLMLACAYHDVGRVDDSYDEEHGMRSAAKVAGLTGCTGARLACLQAAVEAHSRPDPLMNEVLAKYGADGLPAARPLALLLKDADGLDRVRLNMLDAAYLRHAFSARLERAAWQLWRAYPEGFTGTGAS